MADPINEINKIERKKTILEIYEKIQNSKTIIISGGGPIGCEVASDIKIRNKDKRYLY